MKSLQNQCSRCGEGQMREVTRMQSFNPPCGQVEVATQHLCCDRCGAVVTTAQQAERNTKVLDARRSHYGGHLIGADYLRLRKKHGLTQADANLLFGKSGVAFSRYENETSFPDATTTKLIRLAIDSDAVVAELARMAGVRLRLRDERRHNTSEGAPRKPLTGVVNTVVFLAAQRSVVFAEPTEHYLWCGDELKQGDAAEIVMEHQSSSASARTPSYAH